RDPNRDHEHGRIYRITNPSRPLSEHVAIAGEPIPVLLEALEHPINGIRRRARVELSGRDTDEVISSAKEWISGFDPASEADAHHILEGLWLHQQHNVIDRDLLDLVLNSPVPHARIAARTVQIMWDHSPAAARSSGSEAAVRGEGAAAPEMAAMPEPDADAVVIRTVTEEMRYDVDTFQVSPGQEVKLWFENHDYLPHNIVIGEPGSFEAIGAAADALGADGFGVQFIPESEDVLVASDLLEHNAHQVITFTAPMEPGVYDVLCTFPGHRGTMNARMEVRE
ncbi:MAG: cytochrome C precursor, partial [Rhodothermales bacterium]|nr:cytochrome C precursor [Rhodothermales bacterium]